MTSSTTNSWTAKEREEYWKLSDRKIKQIVKYWNNPKNRDFIAHAKPLEYYYFSENEKDQRKPLVGSTDSSAAKQIPDEETPVQAPPETAKQIPDEETPVQAPSDKYGPKSLATSGMGPRSRTALATYNPADPQDTPQVSFVGLDELTTYPYNCVGKLFWLLQGSNTIIHYSTAFYVGSGNVLTVAHAFDHQSQPVLVPLQPGVFVPAMRDKGDIYGEHYGYYPIRETFIPDQYEPMNVQGRVYSRFDITCFKISYGFKKKEDRFQQTGLLFDLTFIPLSKCTDNPEPVAVLGYGENPKRSSPGTLANTIGIMIKFRGNTCQPLEYQRQAEHDAGHIIAMNPDVWYGTSGGPWLNTLQAAIGIQSGINEGEAEESYSPNFAEVVPVLNQLMGQ